MSNSQAGKSLVAFFENKNKNKKCNEWEGVSDWGFSMLAWQSFSSADKLLRDTLRTIKSMGNGVEAFVGSVDGTVSVNQITTSNYKKLPKIKAKFKLSNKTNLNSLFYHLLEHMGERGDNINKSLQEWEQVFIWEKEYPCEC